MVQGGRQILLSLVRKSLSTVSPNSTKDKAGTKIQNELASMEGRKTAPTLGRLQ